MKPLGDPGLSAQDALGWQRSSKLTTWVSLARLYLHQLQCHCPLLRLINEKVSGVVGQKQFLHDIYWGREGFRTLCISLGSPRIQRYPKPTASRHHEAGGREQFWAHLGALCGCPQMVLHAWVSTGVSSYPMNNLIYTASKWEINSCNYPISSILICHWL